MVTTKENIKMLGLNSTNFLENNIVHLFEEALIKKFTSLSSQEQLSFVSSIKNLKDLLQVMNFPLKANLFETPIQLVMLVYTQNMGFNHDQGMPESLLGFLLSLAKSTLFDYKKFIEDSIHEQFNNISSLVTLCYQYYLMYLILNNFSTNFEKLFDPQDPIPYGIPPIIHGTSFVRNHPSSFLHFVDKFISQAYLLIHEEQFPCACQQL